MKCTNKEQETCDVEKRGCAGCFYNKRKLDQIKDKLFSFKFIERRCKNEVSS